MAERPITLDDGGDAPGLLAAAARARTRSHSHLPRSALDGVEVPPRGPWAPWNLAAIVAGALVLAGSLWAQRMTPELRRISDVTVRFATEVRIPEAEVKAWIGRFPFRHQMSDPNDWVLHQLGRHLASWPAVASVPLVRVVHETGPIPVVTRSAQGRPVTSTVQGLRRVLEVTVALRQPYLPGVAEDGSRVWIDAEGRLLPGVLPRPDTPRPTVRMLRSGGPQALVAAVRLWSLLEPHIERGLVTDILLADLLDTPAAGAPATRGLVLRTRTGGRIVWGAPAEEQYGVTPEQKAANLIHTLKNQGDLTRVAMVNVRFKEPFYLPR